MNNAGVTRRADIMDLTEQDWDRIMRVNAKGVFFCLQRVAREMIPRRRGTHRQHRVDRREGVRGHVERDLRGQQGERHLATRTAAQQLARHNINVNAICPGITVTALSEANVAVRARDEGACRWRR